MHIRGLFSLVLHLFMPKVKALTNSDTIEALKFSRNLKDTFKPLPKKNVKMCSNVFKSERNHLTHT